MAAGLQMRAMLEAGIIDAPEPAVTAQWLPCFGHVFVAPMRCDVSLGASSCLVYEVQAAMLDGGPRDEP
jgi:hypothetical protein